MNKKANSFYTIIQSVIPKLNIFNDIVLF